jgi:hypothetical protein
MPVHPGPQMCAAFQGFIKDLAKHAGRSFLHTNAGYSEGMSMRTTSERVWSYGVYYVGYRLLSVQLTCGSWAVSGLALVAKHA